MKIQIKESKAPEIKVDILPNTRQIHFTSASVENLQTYRGSYRVVPSDTETKLLTKNKKMADDVTVTKIPFFVTSNTSGGNTVYIADQTEVKYG